MSLLLLCAMSSASLACSDTAAPESLVNVDAGLLDEDTGVPDAGPTLLTEDASTPDSGLTIDPETSSIVWLHTGRTLYKGDLAISPFAFEKVGDFVCDGYTAATGASSMSMTDLAVDQDENLYAVTSKAVLPLEIDGTSVRCSEIWSMPSGSAGLMGLTFAPQATLDAQKEVLVGADNSGKLWRIDETTGAVIQLGTFGKVPTDDGQGNAYDSAHVGTDFGLSGDIVFMNNNGNPVGFATVRDCDNPTQPSTCAGVDTLIEIDLSKLSDGNQDSVVKSIRGKLTKAADCDDDSEGYGSMYGIAAWDAQVYGFSWSGQIVKISNRDGTSCLISKGQDANGTALKFNGAGITTTARVVIEFN